MKRSAAWPTISQTLKFKSVQNAVAGFFFFLVSLVVVVVVVDFVSFVFIPCNLFLVSCGRD